MNELQRMLDMQNKPMEAGRAAMNAIRYEPPTLRQTLIERRDALRSDLDRVEQALSLFETEPRVTDAIEIIMKAMR